MIIRTDFRRAALGPLALALSLSLLGASALPCLADEAPIATAGAEPVATATSQPVEIIPLPPVRPPADPQAPPEPEHKAHGAVEVGVGTGGYRRAAGVASAPIGKTGEVTVAAERTEGRIRYQ